MPSIERLFNLECLTLLEKKVVFGAAAASCVVNILVLVWLIGGILARQWGTLRHRCSTEEDL